MRSLSKVMVRLVSSTMSPVMLTVKDLLLCSSLWQHGVKLEVVRL